MPAQSKFDAPALPVGDLVTIPGTTLASGRTTRRKPSFPAELPEGTISRELCGWRSSRPPPTGSVGCRGQPRSQRAAHRPDNNGREAVRTSALEGTYPTFPSCSQPGLPGATTAPTSPNVRAVIDYAWAADAAYARITERPITLPSLLPASQIVRDTPSDGPDAGALRASQVFIGAKHRPRGAGSVHPPPPGDHYALRGNDRSTGSRHRVRSARSS